MTTTQPSPGRDVGVQGHYAGSITRLAAYAIDSVAITVLFVVGVRVVEYGVATVTGLDFRLSETPVLGAASFAIWALLYYAYPLAVSGRTLGKAVIGLKVVQDDGEPLRWRAAVVRVVVFPLSFLIFGVGLALILLRSDRRALHDLIAGTAVVYAWDARAAQLRFLATHE